MIRINFILGDTKVAAEAVQNFVGAVTVILTIFFAFGCIGSLALGVRRLMELGSTAEGLFAAGFALMLSLGQLAFIWALWRSGSQCVDALANLRLSVQDELNKHQ